MMTKFYAVENDKTKPGAVTPVYQDPTKQDGITVPSTPVLILRPQQMRT